MVFKFALQKGSVAIMVKQFTVFVTKFVTQSIISS